MTGPVMQKAMELWAETQNVRNLIRQTCKELGCPPCHACQGRGVSWKGMEDGNAYRDPCDTCQGLGYTEPL